MSTAISARDDYLDFCTALRALAGIDLTQYRRGQMERRVRTFVAARGVADLRAYVARLHADREEVAALLDRVTINVSQLWRHPDQWVSLESVVLPDLATAGHIRAWSAGCSYGAEAYSLAAACLRVAPDARLTITGTDIDARMVDRARRGIFTAEDARDAPADVLATHFDHEGTTWVARPALRGAVRFEQGDLLRDEPAPDSFDLVLCRNTVIYFNDTVRDALHARLAGALRPGGRLVVGGAERVADPAAIGLERELPCIYRKAL